MLVNLTDHVVRLRVARTVAARPAYRINDTVELPASASPAFAHKRDVELPLAVALPDGSNASAALLNVVWGDLVNPPPEAQPGVYYIVSTIVARHPALRGRGDILMPARVIKDKLTGAIVGCEALQRSPYADV